MQVQNAVRATPAAAGRDPQIDRAGGAINQTHSIPALSTAIALDPRTRERWQLEAARVGSDWPAMVDLALDIINSTMFESDFERACRFAEARRQPSRPPKPQARPTPQTTIEALIYCVRERGLASLKEPSNIERLSRCDKAALAEMDRRIAKLGGGQ